MAKIGIVPGEEFDINKRDPAAAKALKDVPKVAQEKIMGHFKKAGVDKNGWMHMTKAGTYGTDYLQRAFVTAVGLGANRPQDDVYPIAKGEAAGKPYDGSTSTSCTSPRARRRQPGVSGL
jgi:hypothetical protein